MSICNEFLTCMSAQQSFSAFLLHPLHLKTKQKTYPSREANFASALFFQAHKKTNQESERNSVSIFSRQSAWTLVCRFIELLAFRYKENEKSPEGNPLWISQTRIPDIIIQARRTEVTWDVIVEVFLQLQREL